MRWGVLSLIGATAVLFGSSGVLRAGDAVRVTIVVVLATTENKDVNPKLVALAEEVQKRDAKLTGFKVATTLEKSIPVGESHTFPLPDKQKLKVTIERPRDAEGRIGLTISPPGLGDITYCCSCSKFFPVVTPHKTEKGETLIVAIMAKPCPGKNP